MRPTNAAWVASNPPYITHYAPVEDSDLKLTKKFPCCKKQIKVRIMVVSHQKKMVHFGDNYVPKLLGHTDHCVLLVVIYSYYICHVWKHALCPKADLILKLIATTPLANKLGQFAKQLQIQTRRSILVTE